MANPNIASIGELYGGSLSWTLSPTQPVAAYGAHDANGYQMNNWSNGTQTWSWTMPSAFSDRLLVFVLMSQDTWGNEYPDVTNGSVTYGGTAPTGEVGGANATAWYPTEGRARIFYWVNPPTGANNFIFTATGGMATYSGSSRNLKFGIFPFYNINQTEPFKMQLTGDMDGNDSLLVRKDFGYTAYTSNGGNAGYSWNGSQYGVGDEVDFKVTSSPGDLVMFMVGKQGNVNIYSTPNNGAEVTVNTGTWAGLDIGTKWYSMGNSGSYDPNIFFYIGACPNGTDGDMTLRPEIYSINSSSSDDVNCRAFVLQPAAAPTLFTVPSGYVVKVNQLYVGTSSTGLSFQAGIKGLSTNDTLATGSDIITAVNNGATGTLISGLSIVPGTQTTVLQQPVWLYEGAQLTAGLGFAEPQMKSSSEMKPAPTATCTVSLEVIKQSA